ncbi:hypothetical protein Trydic_g3139 [Trypoxylus dichotomus]
MEYQSKNLLQKHGLTTQKFCLVNEKIGFQEFDTFETPKHVVKAQILAGGRGKGHFDTGFKGGVQITEDKSIAREYINYMLGHRLITKQTPKEGVLVKQVMVAEGVDIAKEVYISFTMDRQCSSPILMTSPEGGTDIETVAKRTPSLIRNVPIDIYKGFTDEIASEISDFLRFEKELKQKAIRELQKLWDLFVRIDALQIEINPFAVTTSGDISCIDAKLTFDDNARHRQKEIFSMEDLSETDPNEIEAARHNLNYVKLHGNIGCLVNGAGLAMATMDMIKLFGGEPANFLDVGGGVTDAQVKQAFNIITSDPNVKIILVNVFGGIVNCEMIARGIIDVAKNVHVPTVVRLEGTQAEAGRKLFSDAQLDVVSATDFEDAARKAVECLKKYSNK